MVSQVTQTLNLIKDGREGTLDNFDYVVRLSLENAIKAAIGLPVDIMDDGLPFARLFSSVCFGFGRAVEINPATGSFCTFLNDAYMRDLNFLFYEKALYPTYEACLADVAAMSCALNITALPLRYQSYQRAFMDTDTSPPTITAKANGVFCSFGLGASIVAMFNFSPMPVYDGCAYGSLPQECQSTTTNDAAGQLRASFFTPSLLSSAVAKVFTPRALCAPFSENANPPYVCTRSERLSALAICIQSLSAYESSISALATLLVVYLHVRQLFGKRPAAAVAARLPTSNDVLTNPLAASASHTSGSRSLTEGEAIALLQRVIRGHAARRVVRGWVKVKDADSGETYYHNKLDGRSEWRAPWQ
jgi:hypothetical protein